MPDSTEKAKVRPRSPKVLKLTHWSVVHAYAAKRFAAPSTRKNAAHACSSRSHTAGGNCNSSDSREPSRLRFHSHLPDSSTMAKIQYRIDGFHLMNHSLCSHTVRPPKTTMRAALIQTAGLIGRRRN